LDLLAIDRVGNLVVIELKRDISAAYADLQSIRYAAMISTMTVENLLPHYIAYRKRYHNYHSITAEDARTQIFEFVETEEFSELTNRTRIILCSEDFSQEITTTVLWLRQFDLDIACVKITPYPLGNQIIIVPQRIIPLQEARQYLIEIQKKEDEQQKATRSKRRARTMRLLVENGLVQPEQRIYLKHALPTHIVYDELDPTCHARITGKLGQSNAVRWEKDSQEYAISNLTWRIFKDLHPDNANPGGVTGAWHWVDENGEPLYAIAEKFLAAQNEE
jgi:hypothetical protein